MLIEKPVSEGDVVSLKLVTGEEVMAKLVSDDVMSYKISKPVILQMGQKGPMMVPYLLTVDMDKNLSISKSNVIAMAGTDKEFANQYIQATTGIAVAG